MREQTKAAKRRYCDGAFHSRFFVGSGLDIGGEPDSLAKYLGVFALLRSVRTWDRKDGDAQHMHGVADGSFDFVHSSHCLEHKAEVVEALVNWVRVVKAGGYLIVTVPDEDLYEQGHWPGKFNTEHKGSLSRSDIAPVFWDNDVRSRFSRGIACQQ